MLKVEIVVGENSLSIETDEPVTSVMPIITLWFEAISNEPSEADHLEIKTGTPTEQPGF